MFKVGKLYICEEYFLLLYPDQEACADAAAVTAIGSGGTVTAGAHAAYWSRKLGKSVSYTDKNIPILSLNNKEKYVEVLAGDRKGWIIYQDWLELKEISNENIS